MADFLSLPPEVLHITATYLPPSSILRLRLVNKQVRAGIEDAFSAICFKEVTFPLTRIGLKSLVRFSGTPYAKHVKVLLLKVDGVCTHLKINKVRYELYLSDALGLLRKRHASLSVGIKYDPTGTIIPELEAYGAHAAVMGSVKACLVDFLLPAIAASGITITTVMLDMQVETLNDFGMTVSNPLLRWLDESCDVSAAVTWDIVLRYHHRKDDYAPRNSIHFQRGSSLKINGYNPDRHTDVLPFLLSNNFTSLTLHNAEITQPGTRLLAPVFSSPAPQLCITNLRLLGTHTHHTITLSLTKANDNIKCEMGFRCGPGGTDSQWVTGEFAASSGAQIKRGVDRLLAGKHSRWVQCRLSGRWAKANRE